MLKAVFGRIAASVWQRHTLLYLAAFGMTFGLAGQIVGVPLLAKRAFHASISQLAGVGLTGPLGYLVFCLATRRLVGRVRPINLAIAGAVLYGTALSLGIWAGSIRHLVLIVIFGSMGLALFWPMIEAAIAQGGAGRKLSRRMGRFNVSWSLGDVTGIVLGGMLYDKWERLPFIMTAVAAVCVALIIALAKRAPGEDGEAFSADADAEDELEVAPHINARFMKAGWVGTFVGAGTMTVVRSLFAAPATDIFHMSGTVYGLAVGMVNVCRTISFWAFMHWRNWHYRVGIYAAGSSLLAVGMVGFVVAAFLPHSLGIVLVFASFAAAGVSIGMTYYSSIFYTVHTVEVAESKTTLHEAIIGGGGAAAVLASGTAGHVISQSSSAFPALASYASMSPFGLCAGAVLAGVAVSWCYMTGRLGEACFLEEAGE